MKDMCWTALLGVMVFMAGTTWGQIIYDSRDTITADYIGQEKPGLHPEIFAPGIISTDAMEFAGTFSPDFTEYYFTRRTSLDSGTNTIMATRKIGNEWTEPDTAWFSGQYFDLEPNITPDGARLYFKSQRPFSGQDPRLPANVWFLEKIESGWTEPQVMGPPFIDIFVMYPSVTLDGTFYFTGLSGGYGQLYRSLFINGTYQEPQRLSTETVNIYPQCAHPFIAPNESYLIFDAEPNAPADYNTIMCISFLKQDGTWTRAIDMGGEISATGTEMTASVSPDGQCFFFYRNEDIFWMDAAVIEQLKFKPQLAINPRTGNAPLTVHFTTDFSETFIPMTSVSWDFDNDGTYESNEQNSAWTFEEPGFQTVTLKIWSDTMSCEIPSIDSIWVFDGESALRFDGHSSHVSCPASSSFNLTGEFTIEAWIHPTGWGEFGSFGMGRIIDKRYISLQLLDTYAAFNPHSLLLQLYHSAGSVSYSNTPANSISLDQWQHIAVTYDGLSELKISINGIEQTLTHTAPPGGTIRDHSGENLFIGSDTNTGNHFQGDMDEVRLWNVARTREEISAGMGSYLSGGEPGLVSYWTMNEGNGDHLIDRSGHAHTATIVAGSWIQGLHFDSPSGDTDGDGILDTVDNCPFRYNPGQEAVENGDIDCSGDINVLDVLAVVNHILGTSPLTGAPFDRADCNSDGNVNVLDALFIVNIILGILPACEG